MHTDWLIVRRIAAELDAALRGSRLVDAGLVDDGRFALRFAGGRSPGTLMFDPFGTPPLLVLEQSEIAIGPDPGFARAAGTALRGMRLASVAARRGDRLVALTFAVRSRFGVASESRLVAELVPRFGNLVLLKGNTIVAAAKQFSPAENAARSIQLGGDYVPPPLPLPRLDAEGFAAALGTTPASWAKALGGFLPLLPRLPAESLAAQAAIIPWADASALAAWLTRRATSLLEAADGKPESGGDVFLYRKDGRLLEAHVVPLAQFADAQETRGRSMLDAVREALSLRRAAGDTSSLERRRSKLVRRIEARLAALHDERAKLDVKLADAAGRELLRAYGEALYTHLTDVPPGATRFVPSSSPELEIPLDPELDPKGNALALFARYRKATDALPHLERRRTAVEARLTSFESLAWEAGRADGPTLSEVESALDALDGARARRGGGTPAPVKRRAPEARTLPSGARVYVGRNPSENVELTFRLARPDDMWFHARNIPGSHVILQRAHEGEPEDADIQYAADLAALHSKAGETARVDVDYTARKYVRKQRDGAPGHVWYTNFKTVAGRPAQARAALET